MSWKLTNEKETILKSNKTIPIILPKKKVSRLRRCVESIIIFFVIFAILFSIARYSGYFITDQPIESPIDSLIDNSEENLNSLEPLLNETERCRPGGCYEI